MEVFYFGECGRRLFGAFHPGKTASAPRVGAVICYPFGTEYSYFHGSCVRLAMILASAGISVLRFDYFGTGDSEGGSHEGTVEQWVADVSTAVDELRAGSDVDRVCLIGIRLGGTLAYLAASKLGGIDGLVMCDPIVRGTAYLSTLMALNDSFASSGRAASRDTSLCGEQGTLDVLGCATSSALREEIGGIDLLSVPALPTCRVMLLDTYDEAAVRCLERRISDAGGSASSLRLIPDAVLPEGLKPVWYPLGLIATGTVFHHVTTGTVNWIQRELQ